jgi:hypothetical protein
LNDPEPSEIYPEEDENGILPAYASIMNYDTKLQFLLMSNLGVPHKINQIEGTTGTHGFFLQDL